MVQVRTCDYTGETIEPGTGIQLVMKDGVILNFKDSKARKNFEQGKDPNNLEWTSQKHSRTDHIEKEHIVETILEYINKPYPQGVPGEKLSNLGLKLIDNMGQPDSDPPTTDEILASLGVIPELPADRREPLVQRVFEFSDDIPTKAPDKSGDLDWDDIHKETKKFLQSKKYVYQSLREGNIKKVDRLKKKQLKAFLGDRLRYLNSR